MNRLEKKVAYIKGDKAREYDKCGLDKQSILIPPGPRKRVG
jgi:hypothetical protein